uniref:EIF-4F 25 kDa subunit n=1 Tax=Steinernema glaseri TaxID=37863 RepID=A0A1I8AQZ2_9BILA
MANREWSDCIRTLEDNIGTVESFWRAVKGVYLPAGLTDSEDYFFFKKGITPMWEDPMNKDGGRIVLCMKGRQDNQPKDARNRLNFNWLELLMALVGEQFSEKDTECICGATVSRRRGLAKLGLWITADASESTRKRLITYMERKLKLIGDEEVRYQPHNQCNRRKNKLRRRK